MRYPVVAARHPETLDGAVEDVEACVGPLRYGAAPSSIPKKCGKAYARLDACMESHSAPQ